MHPKKNKKTRKSHGGMRRFGSILSRKRNPSSRPLQQYQPPPTIRPTPPTTKPTLVPKTAVNVEQLRKALGAPGTVKLQRKVGPGNILDYEKIDVPTDGNCGYHSFIRSMNAIDHNFKTITPDELRKEIILYLSDTKLPCTKSLGIIKQVSGGLLLSKVPKASWMTDTEMDILAKMYSVCVHVWDGQIWSFISPHFQDTLESCANEKQIYIHYSNGHFQVLKPKN